MTSSYKRAKHLLTWYSHACTHASLPKCGKEMWFFTWASIISYPQCYIFTDVKMWPIASCYSRACTWRCRTPEQCHMAKVTPHPPSQATLWSPLSHAVVHRLGFVTSSGCRGLKCKSMIVLVFDDTSNAQKTFWKNLWREKRSLFPVLTSPPPPFPVLMGRFRLLSFCLVWSDTSNIPFCSFSAPNTRLLQFPFKLFFVIRSLFKWGQIQHRQLKELDAKTDGRQQINIDRCHGDVILFTYLLMAVNKTKADTNGQPINGRIATNGV